MALLDESRSAKETFLPGVDVVACRPLSFESLRLVGYPKSLQCKSTTSSQTLEAIPAYDVFPRKAHFSSCLDDGAVDQTFGRMLRMMHSTTSEASADILAYQ